MNQKSILTAIVALIVGAGLGYFGGHALAAPTQSASASRGSFAAGSYTRGGAFGANQAAGGILSGTVASEDSGSITLNTRDGSSHVVLITPDTTIQKSVAGSLSDVTVGSTVIITGMTNSDGSVSASSIQLRPAGSFFPAPQGSTTAQ